MVIYKKSHKYSSFIPLILILLQQFYYINKYIFVSIYGDSKPPTTCNLQTRSFIFVFYRKMLLFARYCSLNDYDFTLVQYLYFLCKTLHFSVPPLFTSRQRSIYFFNVTFLIWKRASNRLNSIEIVMRKESSIINVICIGICIM